MFDNKYPYTDFHELNMDWFLEQFKEYEAKIITQDGKIATMEETVQQFTAFVTNYFDNLDVQQEINNKLDAMAADGTLIELIRPYYDQIVASQNQRIGSLETTATSLQNQINEIVAPAGDPSLTEVANARVSLDGTVYPTLKARLDVGETNLEKLKASNLVTKDIDDADKIFTGYIDTNGIYHNSATNWRAYAYNLTNIYNLDQVKAFTDQSTIKNIFFYSVMPQSVNDITTTNFISYVDLTYGSGFINTYNNIQIPAGAVSVIVVNRIAAYPTALIDFSYEKYSELIDVLSQYAESNINMLDSRMLNAEHSLKTTGNVVNIYNDIWNANDFCIVDDEFWFYKANNRPQSPTTPDVWRKYKLENGVFVNKATVYCDFGHWNTVDYCKETDCLIFGNGANSFDTENNWFAVVPNAKSLSGTVTLSSVGIKYNVNMGYKVQAVWGDDNLGQYNIAIVFSNNATTIKKYLLHKDGNGDFDGTFTEIETASISTQVGVGGADFWDGKLYIGGAGFNIAEIDTFDNYEFKQREKHYYKNDDTTYSGSMQGLVIDSKYEWVFFNYTDSGVSHNCLVQLAR